MPGSNILDLNGRQLQLFLSIFDHQSLAEAARSLNIDPVNAGTAFDVVRRILEDDLFVRTGRGFEPTEFSLQIEPSVREHLARLESLVAPREFHPADELGRITIAANVTELLDEIVQIRDAIMLDAPNCSVRFLELGSRERIEPMLNSGGVDAVITVSAREYGSSLNGCAFSVEAHVIYFDPLCRPPIRDIEEYADAEHATLDFGTSGKSTIDELLEQESLRRRVAVSAPDVAALGALITGTRLITTMQASLSRSTLSHLSYCEPPLYLPPQKFDLVWHRRADNSARSIWLRNLIMRVAETSQYSRD